MKKRINLTVLVIFSIVSLLTLSWYQTGKWLKYKTPQVSKRVDIEIQYPETDDRSYHYFKVVGDETIESKSWPFIETTYTNIDTVLMKHGI